MKLSALKRREMWRLARDHEDDTVVRVVEVVRVNIVRVEPAIVVVVIDIEGIQIAVGVRIVCHAFFPTAP